MLVHHTIALAFDTNLGPVVSDLYPAPIPGDLPFFAELLIPDQIHNRFEDWSVVILHKPRDASLYQYASIDSDDLPLYILNVVNVRYDGSAHRNIVIKGIAVATPSHNFQMFKPLLLFALDDLFKITPQDPNPRSRTALVLEKLYLLLNLLELNIPTLSLETRLLANSMLDFPLRSCCSNRSFVSKLFEADGAPLTLPPGTSVKNGFVEYDVMYNGFRIPLRVPLFSLPDVVGDFSVSEFLKAFSTATLVVPGNRACDIAPHGGATPPILVLVYALITRRRVFFLGPGRSGAEICAFVFAALALISGGAGLVPGLARQTYPYIDLSKYDFIAAQPFFLAGTANPTFKAHNKLWDVLYDMHTNEVILSDNNDIPSTPASPSSGVFRLPHISLLIENQQFVTALEALVREKHDDETAMLVFRQHVGAMIRADARESARNSKSESIISVGTASTSVTSRKSSVSELWCGATKPRKRDAFIGFRRLINSSLGHCASASDMELASVLEHVQQVVEGLGLVVRTETLFSRMLGYLNAPYCKVERFLLAAYLVPTSVKNVGTCRVLECIALGVFHESAKVRLLATEVLASLQKNFLGRMAFRNAMNPFLQTGFESCMKNIGALRYEAEGGEICSFNSVWVDREPEKAEASYSIF